MKEIAAFFIVWMGVMAIIGTIVAVADDSTRWITYLSPQTGICYEIRRDAIVFGSGTAMSPVDSSYCESE